MISLEAALQSGILWYPSVKQKVFISRKIYLFQKSGLPLQLRFSNLAMKNPKMMSSCFIFIYEQCLFTTTSWEDLAAVVFGNLYGRLLNDSGSNYLRNIFGLRLLVWVEKFSIIVVEFGYFVLRKKRRENTAKQVIMIKNLYLRTPLRK